MHLTEKTFLLGLGFDVTQVWEESHFLRAADALGNLGIKLVTQPSNEILKLVVSCIKSLGLEAAEKNLAEGVLGAARSLGLIGQEAARNKVNKIVLEIALALKALGTELANEDMLFPLLAVASSLKEVGKEAARNGMEKEVILSQACLKEIYTFFRSSRNNLETLNQEFSFFIEEIGRCSTREGLDEAGISARILLESFSSL